MGNHTKTANSEPPSKVQYIGRPCQAQAKCLRLGPALSADEVPVLAARWGKKDYLVSSHCDSDSGGRGRESS